jgi:hypothetical protein
MSNKTSSPLARFGRYFCADVFELLRVFVVLSGKSFRGWVPPERKAPAGSFLRGILCCVSDISPMRAGVLGVMTGLFALALDIV